MSSSWPLAMAVFLSPTRGRSSASSSWKMCKPFPRACGPGEPFGMSCVPLRRNCSFRLIGRLCRRWNGWFTPDGTGWLCGSRNKQSVYSRDRPSRSFSNCTKGDGILTTRVFPNETVCGTLVCSRDGNVLRNGDAHEMHDEEKSVHDAEKFECDAIEVHQNDGKAERKDQARNERHEGQTPAEFVRRFLPDRLQSPRVPFGALKSGLVQRGFTRTPIPEIQISQEDEGPGHRPKRPIGAVAVDFLIHERRERGSVKQPQNQRQYPLVLRPFAVWASMNQFPFKERVAILEHDQCNGRAHGFVGYVTHPVLEPVDDPSANMFSPSQSEQRFDIFVGHLFPL